MAGFIGRRAVLAPVMGVVEVRTPGATRRAWWRAGRPLIGIAAVLACGTLFIAPAVAQADPASTVSARSGPCPDIQVVFARGTGEPPGPGRVGQQFADSLRALEIGKSVAVYAVDYPASHDFVRAIDGANDASTFAQGVAATCPDTNVVLGGYSQGAAVIDLITGAVPPILGFADPLPSSVADHVGAVAVFGNPSNRVGGPLTVLSPQYGPKAIDLCNGADPVCSDGNDIPAHSLYVESGMTTQAAQFVADRLAAAKTTQLAGSVS
jgi:cutinase